MGTKTVNLNASELLNNKKLIAQYIFEIYHKQYPMIVCTVYSASFLSSADSLRVCSWKT